MLIGGSSSCRIDVLPEELRGPIGLDQVPEPIDDQRRVRLVGLEEPLQRLAQRPHHLAVVRLFEVGRCEAAREEQSISIRDRQIEMLSEVD